MFRKIYFNFKKFNNQILMTNDLGKYAFIDSSDLGKVLTGDVDLESPLGKTLLESTMIYDESNIIKVRLHALINSSNSIFFDANNYISRDEYIINLIKSINNNKAQIVHFNISYIDDRLAKTIVKIYSKMLFDYAKSRNDRGSIPFHIILEEAHRYVQYDNDINLLGYNIFERITKEGRKYGVLLGLISQRPD